MKTCCQKEKQRQLSGIISVTRRMMSTKHVFCVGSAFHLLPQREVTQLTCLQVAKASEMFLLFWTTFTSGFAFVVLSCVVSCVISHCGNRWKAVPTQNTRLVDIILLVTEIIPDNWRCFSFWQQVFIFGGFFLFVAHFAIVVVVVTGSVSDSLHVQGGGFRPLWFWLAAVRVVCLATE